MKIPWKIPKKHNKIKKLAITSRFIWHINKSKYVYWLDTYSVKVFGEDMCYQTQKCPLFLRYKSSYYDYLG